MKTNILVASIAALAVSGAASAQDDVIDYPVDSVRIIVPSSAGGGTDTNARLVADVLGRYTDAKFAVVNQTAGGGVVAAQTVATGPTDGSQLLLFHAALHVASLSGTWPFGYRDFTPLATTTAFDDVVIAPSDAPYDTLAELIIYAEENPDEVLFGTTFGGTTEVKGNAISAAAGGNLRVVDSGSESDRITAMLGDQVDVTIAGVNNSAQYVESGQAKVLGVLSDTPSPFQPDWPTATSQGIDLSFPLVFTVYGPSDVDPAVVEAFDAVVAKLKESPEDQQKFIDAAQALSLRGPEETASFLEGEVSFVENAMK